MGDLADGEQVEIKGSSATPYMVKNNGGIYSCTCPAWRNQSAPIDLRTCKHLKKVRGEEAELARIGSAVIVPRKIAAEGEEEGEEAPVLLAQSWETTQDLSGWWMSEKLDGVRAYWDGKQFVSRLGNRFFAPEWFAQGLPDHPLDGELWVGRKSFSETISTVRSGAAGERWRQLKFLVFDAPSLDRPFEERIEAVRAVVSPAQTPYALVVHHEACRGIDHLRQELARVEALGGEGLMLRQPASRYEIGRSSTLLKVKSFFDAEAKVVDYVAGAGKHKGRLGSVLVENADGVRFNVGTGFTDLQRKDPPPIGSIITFRYQEITKAGVPRFPSFVGMRIDSDGDSTTAGQPAPMPAPPTISSPTSPPSTPTAPSPAPIAPSAGALRRFEYIEDNSSKFWEVSLQGATYTVTYGRIGAKGTRQSKALATPTDAMNAVDKLVTEKLSKGYVEVTEPVTTPAEVAHEDTKVKTLLRELARQVSRLRLTVAQDFPSGLSEAEISAAGVDNAEQIAKFCGDLAEMERLLAGVPPS